MESFPKVEQERCLLPSVPQALSHLLNGNANFRLKDFLGRNRIQRPLVHYIRGDFVFRFVFSFSFRFVCQNFPLGLKYCKNSNDREVIILSNLFFFKVIIIYTYNFLCQVLGSLTVNNVNKINFYLENVLSFLQGTNLVEVLI